MIAHLGMYGAPALNGALWTAIRARLGYGPDHLTASNDYWSVWQNPDLLFSQTCGYPFRARLHDTVQLIGTPDYALPDCAPGYYYSVILAREDDPRELSAFDGACLAFNEALSQSGWAAPMHLFAGMGLRPASLLETGAHAASMTAVIDGQADFAGIDAVTWDMARRSGLDDLDRLRVIARTEPTPGLPYITSRQKNAAALASAVADAIADLPPQTRDQLMLRGLVQIPASDYLSVPTPPPPAEIAPITRA